jgi:probable addiction module antidote protein
MKPSVPYSQILKRELKDPKQAIGYLNACLENEDMNVFLLALADVASVHGGLSKIARTAKLDRVHLYRMLSRQGNPGMRNVFKLLRALGFQLTLTTSTKIKKAA